MRPARAAEIQRAGGLVLLLIAVVAGFVLQLLLTPHDAQAIRPARQASLPRLDRSPATGSSVEALRPAVSPSRRARTASVTPAVDTGFATVSSSIRRSTGQRAPMTIDASLHASFRSMAGPIEPPPIHAKSSTPTAAASSVAPQNADGAGSHASDALKGRGVTVVSPVRSVSPALPSPSAAPEGAMTDRDEEGASSDSPARLPKRQDATPDPDSGGTQLLVLGPAAAHDGEFITYSIILENGHNIVHSPLLITYNPEVLQFVEAQEGPLLSSDGVATQFFAKDNADEGIVNIALSRMPPAQGFTGGGALCTVTFIARGDGVSPILTAGSRLLDPSSHRVSFRGNDAEVAIQP